MNKNVFKSYPTYPGLRYIKRLILKMIKIFKVELETGVCVTLKEIEKNQGMFSHGME